MEYREDGRRRDREDQLRRESESYRDEPVRGREGFDQEGRSYGRGFESSGRGFEYGRGAESFGRGSPSLGRGSESFGPRGERWEGAETRRGAPAPDFRAGFGSEWERAGRPSRSFGAQGSLEEPYGRSFEEQRSFEEPYSWYRYSMYSVTVPRGRYTGRGPKNYKRSDDRILEDVSERLEQSPDLDASEIEVAVENGEVTLKGKVEDRHAKRLAEDLAESVSGVREVHNHLRVEQGFFARLFGSSDEGTSRTESKRDSRR